MIGATICTAISGLGHFLETRGETPFSLSQKAWESFRQYPVSTDRFAYAMFSQLSADHPQLHPFLNINAARASRDVHERWKEEVLGAHRLPQPADYTNLIQRADTAVQLSDAKTNGELFIYNGQLMRRDAAQARLRARNSRAYVVPEPIAEIKQLAPSSVEMVEPRIVRVSARSSSNMPLSLGPFPESLDDSKRERKLTPARGVVTPRATRPPTEEEDKATIKREIKPVETYELPADTLHICPSAKHLPIVFLSSMVAGAASATVMLLAPEPNGTSDDTKWGFVQAPIAGLVHALGVKVMRLDQSALFAFLAQMGATFATNAIYSAAGPNW